MTSFFKYLIGQMGEGAWKTEGGEGLHDSQLIVETCWCGLPLRPAPSPQNVICIFLYPFFSLCLRGQIVPPAFRG